MLLALGVGTVAGAVRAEAPYQSLAAVQKAVEAFVRQQAQGPGEVSGIKIDRLDPRLRLRACESELQPFLPKGQPGAGRLTVGVRCAKPKPWKLYVPVQIVRRIRVVVAKRPVPRGVALGKADLELQSRRVARLNRGYYLETQQVAGLETRRPMQANEVVTPGALTAPRLVRHGQTLVLEASTGGISVSMKGLALEDGGKGDLIRVRNLSSDRIVQGRVVGRDRVQVTL
jgi:flagella basal body P-ring formation protein FlgA